MLEAYYKNLPVLVTGGCGFIGSHVAQKLVNLGAQVTILDDLSAGSLNNIEPIKDKVTLIIGNITDYDMCLQATRYQKIIFHLAAFISVPQSMQEPKKCYEINVNGTLHLLEAARINNVERFIFSSSAAVYGPTNEVCTEETSLNPQSPYGYSKLIGELYCQQYAKNFGINAVILRYFNVWGERQNPYGAYAGVVAKFINQMELDLPITLFGDGMQTRDFVPVDTVAFANLQLGMKANEISGHVLNIGTGKSITLLELIEQLKKQFPKYSQPIEFTPVRSGDIKSSRADCSKYTKYVVSVIEKAQ
jgi:nucleoside-diphosphate-sugar epimerase